MRTVIAAAGRARGRGRRAADLPHRVQRAHGVGAAVVVGLRNARRRVLFVPAGRRLDVRGGARRAHRRREHRADAVDAAASRAGFRAACCHGATDDRAPRARRTARFARSTTSRSPSTTASSSRSSARRAAARRRCCARSPASTSPMPAASSSATPSCRRADAHVPPERRRIGIVFQSYALWPHMSVAENVAYGLDGRGREGTRARAPRRRRARAGRSRRLRQRRLRRCCRAASASAWRSRAASSPSRRWCCSTSRWPISTCTCAPRWSDEFARFHERTGTTMVYITHDQAEAMALADRIAVMDHGRVLQVATPVAALSRAGRRDRRRFIGEGMVVPAEVVEAADGMCTARLFDHLVRLRCAPDADARRRACCVRAQALRARRATAASPRACRASPTKAGASASKPRSTARRTCCISSRTSLAALQAGRRGAPRDRRWMDHSVMRVTLHGGFGEKGRTCLRVWPPMDMRCCSTRV